MKYIFDTNAFNNFLDAQDNTPLHSVSILATHVQLAEIKATKDDERRNCLLNVFSEITDEVKKTESMVFPLIFGAQKFGDGTYENLLESLNQEVSQFSTKKRLKKENGHSNDAQIAEVALKNKYTLVTDDNELIKVFENYGGKVLRYAKFIEIVT